MVSTRPNRYSIFGPPVSSTAYAPSGDDYIRERQPIRRSVSERVANRLHGAETALQSERFRSAEFVLDRSVETAVAGGDAVGAGVVEHEAAEHRGRLCLDDVRLERRAEGGTHLRSVRGAAGRGGGQRER